MPNVRSSLQPYSVHSQRPSHSPIKRTDLSSTARRWCTPVFPATCACPVTRCSRAARMVTGRARGLSVTVRSVLISVTYNTNHGDNGMGVVCPLNDSCAQLRPDNQILARDYNEG